ncbi:uncharacterized protein VTP21DRAFT_583 [Calcarisporiella thermophila]|uniref:uncharacterized protein n=1 Tax=Calcarisporiella thermophila TaxID=911321 RepID=UPI0037449832
MQPWSRYYSLLYSQTTSFIRVQGRTHLQSKRWLTDSTASSSDARKAQLTSLTVIQLRQLLRERGQKVTGRKSELICRVIESDADAQNALHQTVSSGVKEKKGIMPHLEVVAKSIEIENARKQKAMRKEEKDTAQVDKGQIEVVSGTTSALSASDYQEKSSQISSDVNQEGVDTHGVHGQTSEGTYVLASKEDEIYSDEYATGREQEHFEKSSDQNRTNTNTRSTHINNITLQISERDACRDPTPFTAPQNDISSSSDDINPNLAPSRSHSTPRTSHTLVQEDSEVQKQDENIKQNVDDNSGSISNKLVNMFSWWSKK